MVRVVRRSTSFTDYGSPLHCKDSNKDKSLHVRSISLPCKSHPIISQIEDEIKGLQSWQSKAQSESSSLKWLCNGLNQIKLLHQSAEDLLQLSHVQDAFHQRSCWTERILKDFLCIADVYGTFRSTICDMKNQLSETQSAIWRQDEARLASCIRSQKRTEKELAKLASRVQEVSRAPASLRSLSNAEEAEVAGIMRELILQTASTTQSVFFGVAAASAAISEMSYKPSGLISSIRKKVATTNEMQSQQASEKLVNLAECINTLQSTVYQVFRSLINSRVSLLNILSSY